MNRQEFIETCNDAFLTLRTMYELFDVRSSFKATSCECIFSGDIVAIRVYYDFRDIYVLVQICRLVDGNIALPPGEIEYSTEINCYDVDFLLALRKPDFDINTHGYVNSRKCDLYVALLDYALDIGRYGSDVLSGNFEVFNELERIVKRRALEAAVQKWGDQVHMHGW